MEAPETVGLHLGTWHSDPGFCSNTPGVYARWQSGLTVGAYKNSACRSYSGYAGWTWETEGRVRAAITVGAVTGYKLASVLPLVAPSLIVDVTPSIALRGERLINGLLGLVLFLVNEFAADSLLGSQMRDRLTISQR
jgi:hypothetical protein